MLHFESPYVFLLLILIPAIFLLRRYTAKRGAVRFSTITNAAKAGLSWRQRLYPLPAVIRLLALICLIIALARPQTGREEIIDISQGVAIEMVIDRSGSMSAEMEYNGRQMTRLDVVKDVFKNFALGDGRDLPGRPNDLIGIVAFARYADTICPLTLAHGALAPFLDTVKLVQVRSEDGTAIGDALALAAARLEKAEETLARQQAGNKKTYDIKSKIIILLSDGENNAGKRDPLEAARLAARWGIKVYSIAIGHGGSSMQSIKTPFGVYKVPVGHSVDTTVLRQIAEETGGFFREAGDAASLAAIYKEIDKMEKSDVESVKYVDYKEAFLPFAFFGLMLIVAEVLLVNTVFRKLP
jgi:Ca-activated chloride channel family protein